MNRTRSAIAFVAVAALAACSGGSTAPKTGDLTITVAGLPGLPASIDVLGSGGYNQIVTATTTLTGIPVGTYQVDATNVMSATATYTPTPVAANVTLTTQGGSTAVTYSLASGSIALGVTGLPNGVSGNVLVTGPQFTEVFTAPQTIYNLTPGSYTVTGNTAVSGTTTYGGTPFTQTVPVTASLTAANAAVAYSAMTGQIAVTVSGIPGGSNPNVLVTGPFSYSHSITANGTATLTSLPLGAYTITADSVIVGPLIYYAQTAVLVDTLNGGTLSKTATVTYAVPDLSIDGMYITQSTQTYTGTVPLVASRDGFLRVFVKADHANTWMPQVRVRWYTTGGTMLVRTDTIQPTGGSVPTAITEGVLSSSWNLPVPGALIQPGLSVVADVDPSNLIVEGNETNNSFPVSGTPLALNVQVAQPANVMLVPVTTSDGRTGAVNSGNLETFMTFMQKIHPIPSHVASLHATFVSNAGPLQSDDGNNAWDNVLAQVDAQRTAESAPAQQHYIAVVDPNYNAGVAGLAYVGGKTAEIWDRGMNDQILAHEIGHNWGRNHSPCGNPAMVDPNYPYPNAIIGVYGFDVSTKTLYAPTTNYDIMSYCQPYWISDYTYEGVLEYRAGNPDIVSAASAAAAPQEPVLLVWGRMRGNEMVLEPAFEITARAKEPAGSGAYSIEALDANGARLFSYAFDAQEVADEPGGARNFSFAIPLSRFDISRLATLQLVGQGRTVQVSAAAPAATGLLARVRASRAEVSWNSANYPMALVRDARTGQVLSFARGGFVRLAAPATDLVVTVSNGVRSTTESVRAQ